MVDAPPILVNSLRWHQAVLVAVVWSLLVGLTAAEEPAPPETHVLRPRWEIGKIYRLQQRLDARTTLPGFGKQVLDWRQQIAVTPKKIRGQELLEISPEVIRVDVDMGGRRSRYYFRPHAEKRFQDPDAEGTKMRMLGRVERLVDHRYQLLLDGADDESTFRVVDTAGKSQPRLFPKRKDVSEIPWSDLPWHGITSVLLHQGIPEEPLAPKAEWTHKHHFDMGERGHLNLNLSCEFDGFRKVKDQRLALVEFRGSIEGVFRQQTDPDENPGIDIKAPKIKGLTLIDPVQRAIMSTVLKIDGNVTALGADGKEEGDTAAVKKTLTLTLLTIDELPTESE